MLGAEPLHVLVAAAHLGDAMERDVLSGTVELFWFASIGGWERFLSELALAGEKSCQGCVCTARGGELLLWQRCCSDLWGQIMDPGHKGRRMWSVQAFLGPCQGLHLSHCSLEPSTHPYAWQPRTPQALHGRLLGQGGETLASSLEKHLAPLPAFPTGPSPPRSLTDGERIFWFLKSVYEYTHLRCTEFFDGSCAR